MKKSIFLSRCLILCLNLAQINCNIFKKKDRLTPKNNSILDKIKPEFTLPKENVTPHYCYDLMQKAGYDIKKKEAEDIVEYTRKKEFFMLPIAYANIGSLNRKNFWILSIGY